MFFLISPSADSEFSRLSVTEAEFLRIYLLGISVNSANGSLYPFAQAIYDGLVVVIVLGRFL